MENEVIIDGVNVAECEFFDNKEDECLIRGYGKKHIMMFNCKHNPNCYFKQLQRAKAENEKLKNRNKLYKKIIVENQQKYHNQVMILKACIKGEINIDDFKNFAKVIDENKRLKAIADKALNDKNKWLAKYNILLSKNEKLKLMLSEKNGVYR